MNRIHVYVAQHWEPIVLVFFVMLFLGFGLISLLATKTFNAPDERMHHYYVRTLGETGRLPQLTGEKVTKESHQPPLYYVLAQIAYQPWRQANERTLVVALRLFTLLLSGGVVVITFLLARLLFPGQPLVTLGTPALVALNPQFIFMSGVINNDALANVLGALCVYLAVVLLVRQQRSNRLLFTVGLIAAAAFLTKTTLWPFALGLVGIALYQERQRIWRMVGYSTPLVVVASWWLILTIQRYDSLTGFSYLRELWYSEQHKDFLSLAGLRQWGSTLFRSYWARFGYFNLALPNAYYLVAKLLSAVAAVGLVVFIVRQWKSVSPNVRRGVAIGAIACVIVFVGVFYYNLSFYQPQGRYLFPVMSVLSLLTVVGLRQFTPRAWERVVLTVLIVALLTFDFKSIQIIQTYA